MGLQSLAHFTHLCLLWPAAHSHNLLYKLLLLQLDCLLHSNLTEGVHWVLHTIRHHACVVRLHTNLRRRTETAGQSHYRGARWLTVQTVWIWGKVFRHWQTHLEKGSKCLQEIKQNINNAGFNRSPEGFSHTFQYLEQPYLPVTLWQEDRAV